MGTSTDSLLIGQRWGAALRLRYPGRKPGELDAKRCAAAFGVSPRTAEGWAAGQSPYAKHLLRGWRLHGAALVFEVLAPGTDAARLARIESMRDELERRFHAMGDELAQLRLEAEGP